MHHMVARLSHENHALRHHIAATGGAPLPPHLQMPATPPPLVVLPPGAAMPPGMVPVHPSMMPQTQKVPLPAAAAAGVVAISVPESSGPKPGNLLDDAPSVEKAPVVAAASTATAPVARGGKRRKGAGGSVAAVTAGALAVLSVVCLAGVSVTTGGAGRAAVGGVDSPAAAQLALGSSVASYGHQMTARRRLMGIQTEPEAEAGDMEPIPMRGISREIALRPEPAGVDLWDARGKASYTEVLTGALNEITLNPEASSVQTKNRGVSFENASFDDGEADPLFAAFAAAGLRADALSRVICSEMFRWTPAGNVTAGSGLDVELARRVRVAMEDGESEEDGEEAAVKGTRTIETTTNGQTSAGELLPSAIPLPPSVAPDGTSVALNVMGPGDGDAPGGTKRAEAAAARSISSGTFDGEDDAKLVSVLFSEETSEDTGDERLFVVTHSPRSSEYVTYACRFPRGTYIGSTAARSGA
jgi:hypothetical protein